MYESYKSNFRVQKLNEIWTKYVQPLTPIYLGRLISFDDCIEIWNIEQEINKSIEYELSEERAYYWSNFSEQEIIDRTTNSTLSSLFSINYRLFEDKSLLNFLYKEFYPDCMLSNTYQGSYMERQCPDVPVSNSDSYVELMKAYFLNKIQLWNGKMPTLKGFKATLGTIGDNLVYQEPEKWLKQSGMFINGFKANDLIYPEINPIDEYPMQGFGNYPDNGYNVGKLGVALGVGALAYLSYKNIK